MNSVKLIAVDLGVAAQEEIHRQHNNPYSLPRRALIVCTPWQARIPILLKPSLLLAN